MGKVSPGQLQEDITGSPRLGEKIMTKRVQYLLHHAFIPTCSTRAAR